MGLVLRVSLLFGAGSNILLKSVTIKKLILVPPALMALILEDRQKIKSAAPS